MRKALLASAVMLGLSSIASATLLTPNGSFAFSLEDCCYLNGANASSPGDGDLLTATTIGWSTFAGQPDFQITTHDPTTFGNPNIFQSLYHDYGDISNTTTPAQLVNTGGGDTLTVDFALDASNSSIPGDSYQFVSNGESVYVNSLTRSVDYYFTGTFSDLNSPQVYSNAPASFTLQFSQSAPNASIDGSGTFSTPPAPNTFSTPEPGTIALIGAALIGLATMRRKKA